METAARAAALGGLHGGGGHAQHQPPHRQRRRGPRGPRPRRSAHCARWRWPGPSPWAEPGSAWPPWASWPRWACGCSPTTAPACRTPASCAGPSSTPGASTSRWASTARTAPLAAGGHMHEGEWSSRLGVAGHPGRGRGADGGARHRAGPADRGTGALPAPVDGRVGGAGGGGQGRGAGRDGRGDPAPPGAHRRRAGRLRRRVQGQPARCAPTPTSPRCAPPAGGATVDAVATDHAPHPPRAQGRAPSTPPLRACSGSRPPSPSCSGAPRHGHGAGHGASRDVLGPAVVAPGPHRRAGASTRVATRAGPSSPARPATSASIDPAERWEVDPGAPGQPEPQHARGRAGRSPARSATPCSGASPWSWTPRRTPMTSAASTVRGTERRRCAARPGRRRGVRG